MLAKKKDREEQPRSGYFYESARPFTSLIFILPMLVAYQGGILAMGADKVHNGAADWLQHVLSTIGIGNFVVLPAITCALLLGWHYVKRLPWKFSPWVLLGMLAECGVWAALLWCIFRGWAYLVGSAMIIPFELAQLLGFFGAGIYEELLFRVILLLGVAAVIKSAGAPQRASLITAVIVSAVLFAVAHYQIITPGGWPFSWAGVTFHLILGVVFGILFVLRGFGITVGTHALYNILVMLLKV